MDAGRPGAVAGLVDCKKYDMGDQSGVLSSRHGFWVSATCGFVNQNGRLLDEDEYWSPIS